MELRPVPRRAPLRARIWVAVATAIVAPLTLLVVIPGVLGLQRYVVSGNAMSGSLDRGSLILANPVPASDLRPGEVISFVPPAPYASGVVTRRVERVGPQGVETMSDRTHRTDPWRIPASDVAVSRMVLHVPWVGYPFLTATGRGTWLLVALVPLAAVGLALLADVRRRRRVDSPAARPRLPGAAVRELPASVGPRR